MPARSTTTIPFENAFSPFIRILGKGKTGSRSLSQTEAHEAMKLILNGEVEDVQLGAFLMLLRVKEESAEEIAGFVAASREYIAEQSFTEPSFNQQRTVEEINALPAVDLDWSSYAGKRKQPHWFILAALLLSQSGYRVLMHGTHGHTEGRVYTQSILEQLGIPIATHIAHAAELIADNHFAYLPLGHFCEPLERLIRLRPLFGLRSPVHTLCRLINPFAANATLQSVFHPAYMQTHHQAAALLKEDHAIVFKGDAGEAEYRPHASVKIKQLSRGQSLETTLKRRCTAPIEVKPSAQALIDLWKNDRTDKQTDSAVIDPAVTEYSVNAVLGTTAIALLAMQKAATEQEAFLLAEKLWDARDRNSLG